MGSGLDDILANSLILRQLIPYLPISAILALSSTCKTHQETLAQNPDVFRYLDLSVVASALPCRPIDIGGMTWRRDRVDEALTQDEFAAGPLRGIFSKLSRRGVLDNVQTMILDGLGVTAELVHDIITMDKFNVRILSIRECPFINERRLMQVLQTAVRPSRANDTPRVNGLYVLGPRRFQIPHAVLPEQSSTPIEAGVTQSVGAQIGASWNEKSYHALNSSLAGSDDRWYHSFGKLVKFRNSSEAVEWAATLKKCEGIIAFDAILCRGPRHDESRLTATDENGEISSESWLPPRIATVALGSGCQKCGTMPEGPATFDSSPMSQLPLLDPPPLRSSNIQQAQKPHLLDPSNKSFPPLFVRCEDCLRARWCERCMKWWCEDCYSESVTGKRFSEVSPNTTNASTKVHMGLCTEKCLVRMLMSQGGEGGMWG